MSYRKNAKIRRLRARLLWLLSILKFKVSIFTIPNQLIIIWAIIAWTSLFFPWIQSAGIQNSFVDNSFSFRLWYIWYILLFLVLIIFLLPFSNNKKEKIKTNLSISFRDHNLIILSSTLVFLMSYVSLNFVKWLSIYSKSISYWEWIILCFIWGIFSFAWWLMLYREYKKDIEMLFLENNWDIIRDYVDDDKNMRLPF